MSLIINNFQLSIFQILQIIMFDYQQVKMPIFFNTVALSDVLGNGKSFLLSCRK